MPANDGRLGSGRYPDVDAHPSFPELEKEIVQRWEAEKTFERSIDQREGGDEFVFYDGPPFANGLPHYGHLLTGFVKDAVPRYQTMRGRKVERRFGWDCHGLPAEMEAEKRLGVSGRMAIEALGVGTFNEECRLLVSGTADSWHSYVRRQARWVDMANDYKTMDLSFMESVMWAFKTLHDKGLAYEGQRVLPYCWECETPLSNFETRMDDAYRERQDPAVTVWFELTSGPHAGKRLLVWTTTPWTLPSNLAIAVGPGIAYAVFRDADGTEYVLGEGTVDKYAAQLEGMEQVATVTGAELAGASYTPIFDFFAGTENAHRVLPADWVDTGEGTGSVHIAPGFGEDDKALSDEHGIPTIAPVDEKGAFTSEVPPYAGMQVFDANSDIVRDLKARGVVVRHDSYLHSYPHCWRTDTPLIYKAVSSWFVAVTAIKDRMLELNQQIDWVPGHVKDGSFGRWLEGARDWSISRNRFWGSPIPVWKSDDPAHPRIDVYGSIEDLERDFGVTVTDLHRPMIDELVRPNPDDPTGRSMMRRIPDVLDCWFESGSMPFAQVHYPFENREWFESHFPGDFIVEYIGQTRGWFYTMHVLAGAIFDRPAFSTCLSHGIVLGSDGAKMSKSLRNYPDVREVFDRDGADAMRWFLMSSPILRGGNLVVTEQGIRDSVRQVLIPLWNSWSFFSLYANAAGSGRGHDAQSVLGRTDAVSNPMDRYILAKLRDYVAAMTDQLDNYEVAAACDSTRSFLDVLTNWYIRRSRERFWDEDADAFDTLYTVLEVVGRLTAPLLPLTTEEVWRGLTGERSVHLADWPAVEDLPADEALVASMDTVRDVCSAGSALRKAANLRNRLPLTKLSVVTEADLTGFETLVADELNLKGVELLAPDAPDAAAYGVSQRLTVNARAAGPRLGKDVQLAIKGSKSGDWTVAEDGTVIAGGLALVEGEYALETVAGTSADDTVIGMLPHGGFVVLDTALTPELEAEGTARDLVRAVQQARKDAGLQVSDRIALTISAPSATLDAARTHEALIAEETLATSVSYADAPEVRVRVVRA